MNREGGNANVIEKRKARVHGMSLCHSWVLKTRQVMFQGELTLLVLCHCGQVLGTKTAAKRINLQGCFRAEMLYSEFLQELLFVVN